MNKTPDSSLIEKYQEGSEIALETLINRHKSDLFTYIYYKIGSEELANDFFQDTFIKIILFLKEKRYCEEGKFIVWAKRIAHNIIIDHYRKKNKYTLISETTYESEEFSIFDFIANKDECIEDEMIKKEINSDLIKLLVYLPENQQEIIQLRYFDNLSFKDIAEQTDTSINTTLGRLRYALINLRKIISKNNIILSYK